MPTPRERIKKILAAKTPSLVIYKPREFSGVEISLSANKVQESSEIPIVEDAEFQSALRVQMREFFDRSLGKWTIDTDVPRLWSYIQGQILHYYGEVSTRCEATKRKTQKFISGITLEDTHLANFVIQLFVKTKSDSFKLMNRADKEKLFEAFEGLRRSNYGKQFR